MMKNNIIRISILMMIVSLSISSCKKDEDDDNTTPVSDSNMDNITGKEWLMTDYHFGYTVFEEESTTAMSDDFTDITSECMLDNIEVYYTDYTHKEFLNILCSPDDPAFVSHSWSFRAGGDSLLIDDNYGVLTYYKIVELNSTTMKLQTTINDVYDFATIQGVKKYTFTAQ